MSARLVVLAVLLAGCGSKPESEPVRIFAAASLREAVTEIATEWTKRTGRPHRLQFEASSTLARQIQEGAPVDVFISADKEWMDRVSPCDRRDWLGNGLVCVVPKDRAEFDLKSARRLALANEQVPAGKYAKAALAHLGIVPPEPPIYGSNVRDVLAKVSQGGAEAGIVYATDAAVDPGVRVAFTFPEESHPRIVYPAGLLQEGGRAFFDALRESWALEIARRQGFIVAGP
ncbi:MAG TPA: molybdate ABC transporter substrate-binding protein [Planctomycetota bacterium]|nr:molybdate ABC transporter substrate-binding protein [Planctomycetota bacterium]